ncbi:MULTISPECIES: hypothetical protein [Paenibacillus]|uniref:hypothetical protein n=1 Tax=Paenibacillus TaxID=44249 RepID=UPI0022B860D4|nr:hypothetical protein [Paenibacillus caseinilyticus]MCZ8519853.1 hypothetical protein [Paenibacillus caseinilyticus]
MRLGQQKEKYEALNAKLRHLGSLDGQIEALESEREQAEEGLGRLEKEIRRRQRELQDLQDRQVQEESRLRQIVNQLLSKNDALDTAKGECIALIREMEDLKELAPQIYHEGAAEGSWEPGAKAGSPLPSSSQMRTELEKSRVQFNQARQEKGIDQAAPENYKVVEAEYHRLQDEYKRTSLLLEQDQERTGQLKDQLETTINMRVLEIQQRFKSYMSVFQFEGEMEWDQYEDRRGRIHFHLYIKARKEGHRGTLEDVSVKARGGRVGKGVSGGEESLSSLLFALALLQNLQTSPGFIVLDDSTARSTSSAS